MRMIDPLYLENLLSEVEVKFIAQVVGTRFGAETRGADSYWCGGYPCLWWHYSDVMMNAMASLNHQPHDCLLNRLFRCRSKKTPKLSVTGLCAGNSPVTREFLAQRASNAENASNLWGHHGHAAIGVEGTHAYLEYVGNAGGGYVDKESDVLFWAIIFHLATNEFPHDSAVWWILATSHISITVNTLKPRQNGRHFPDDIFLCIFLNENVWISPGVSLKFVAKIRINNIPALVRLMVWHRLSGESLSEPMIVKSLTHVYVTLNGYQYVGQLKIIIITSHIQTIRRS